MRRTLRELSDANRKISEYENRMTLLGQQIERLNSNLRIKMEELNTSESGYRNYKRETETKIIRMNSELDDYRRKTG